MSVAPRASDSESFQVWLNGLVNAYILNCARLKTMRGEDPTVCRALVE